eukprot:TRINITY_DN5148_c0_g4_i1.p1 TRINITY_DN5148_c0_g4~~TRINITY_DN5148_c0_g4_i1.p1  ORF type:complete len:234 (+),score=95.14 TRINITY_DN5148_c0_g4_i1:71-772(+)
MADRVEYTMERMLSDLILLEKKEVLSRKEVKDILQKRRDFEYRMQSKAATDIDFLEAIAYEKELNKRVKAILKARKEENRGVKAFTAEFSVTRRIMMLYDRLLARYKSRTDIFKRYLRFLISEKAYKKLSSAIATHLATNAQDAEVWRIAVYAEFEVNGNSETARKLFLKALGMISEDENLWAYYMKFELDFIAKVKEREKILSGKEKKLMFIEEEEKKDIGREEGIDFTVPK